MNEEQNNQKKEPIKITLGLALGWGLGVLAAISGVTLLFSEPLTGFLMLLLAAVLLPPANKFITDKLNFSISRGMKINFRPQLGTTIEMIRVTEFRIGQ